MNKIQGEHPNHMMACQRRQRSMATHPPIARSGGLQLKNSLCPSLPAGYKNRLQDRQKRLMLHDSDACLQQRVGTYCMIMCSVKVFMELYRYRSSWTSSIITYMHHLLGVQYSIHRCGTTEGTNQHRTTRASFDLTPRCSSISFLSLNLMRRLTH